MVRLHNTRRGQNFHEGEVQLQNESGVDAETFDAMVSQAFQPELSEVEVRFVNGRTFSVAASIDDKGRPWASPLFGAAGELLSVIDSTTVRVTPPSVDGDPFIENVTATGEMGVLYFDPSRRRRAKSLGHGTVEADGTITYRMTRNFGLCNKYIFKRSHDGADSTSQANIAGASHEALSADDTSQLEAADTAFLASFHVDHGTDPTHRGGPPGFITVVDDRTISMPDYVGNGMFQTLGNLLLDDRIGLMAVDFASGRTVHVTGRGAISASPADDHYSERTLTIAIDEVRVSHHDAGTWTDIEAFELRPGLINPATPYRSPR